MIDHDRRLLFVHISRTGGSSIENLLVGADWGRIDMPTKHMSASQMRKYYGEEIWANYVKFTVVRNPWDRLISMWATKWWDSDPAVCEQGDMVSFLRQLKPHANEACQSLHYHEILDEELDHVLRFENLQSDLVALLRPHGISDVVLPLASATYRGHYSNYYTSEAAEMAGAMFGKDIERFGYTFEPAGTHGSCAWDSAAGRFHHLQELTGYRLSHEGAVTSPASYRRA